MYFLSDKVVCNLGLANHRRVNIRAIIHF